MKAWIILAVAAALSFGQPVPSNGQSNPQVQSASDLQQKFEEARRSAERGDAKGQAALGFYYMVGIGGVNRDPAEAAKWYRKAAEQGSAGAQLLLGGFYARGEGVARDYSQARTWYRRAAEQGDEQAQTSLGELYEKGNGGLQDYEEAIRWYRKAAEIGWPAAQLNLGFMYLRGQGVPQDYVEAHMWVNLALSQVDGPFATDDSRREAASIRDSIAEKMTAQQIGDAQRRAREWKPIGASASTTPTK